MLKTLAESLQTQAISFPLILKTSIWDFLFVEWAASMFTSIPSQITSKRCCQNVLFTKICSIFSVYIYEVLRILRNRHLLIEIRAISGNDPEEISGKLDSVSEGSVTDGPCQRPEPALFSAPLIVIKVASHFPKRDGPTWRCKRSVTPHHVAMQEGCESSSRA